MKSDRLEAVLGRDPRLARRVIGATDPSPDVAPLLRTSILRSRLDKVDLGASPLAEWPEEFWATHGLRKSEGGIVVVPWSPAWLENVHEPVGWAAALLEQRRRPQHVQADRFYSKSLGRKYYSSEGQRMAVRCSVVASPKATLTCVLPTGTGKTDVFLTRAIMERPRQSLMIVPTVSLALDIERRVQEQLGSSEAFAYFGDLDPHSKEVFRERVATGSQWLIITSPEAACTALANPLKAAAAEGRLSTLCIDEAHIVSEWGDDFRLEFQTFAALRRELLELSPPRQAPATLLLSGTLDQHGFDTLSRLFPGDEFVLVSHQMTRPEPEWWSAKCADENEKRARLLEAVARLPRPLLIYTTLHTSDRTTNVGAVLQWLQDEGYQNVASIDGNSNANKRRAAIAGLKLQGNPLDDLDIVVATSAFGLGVDIDDIRSVIHACLPESVNRLYQEVGRAGRDGKATTSLVLWTEADDEVAGDIAAARTITKEKAWSRWVALRTARLSDDPVKVDLATPHADVKYPFSEANRFWNVQTLLGMQRVGMLEIKWPEAPVVPPDANDDQIQGIFEAATRQVNLTLLQADLNSLEVFGPRFDVARQRLNSAGNASLRAAQDVVGESGRCVNRILAEQYAFVDSTQTYVPVWSTCGGCAFCRAQGAASSAIPATSVTGTGAFRGDASQLVSFVGWSGHAAVRSGGDLSAERTLVERLIRSGVRRIVTEDLAVRQGVPEHLDLPYWIESLNTFARRTQSPLDVPTLLVASRVEEDGLLRRALERLDAVSVGIVLCNAEQKDPRDERQYLFEAFAPSRTIEQSLRSL